MDIEQERIGENLTPVVCDDEKINVLKHCFCYSGEKGTIKSIEGVEFSIVNVSDIIINKAIFEIVFFDGEGSKLYCTERKILELEPGIVRTFRIIPPISERNNISSYLIRILKTEITPLPTATGNEKVLILKHKLLEVQADDHGVVHPAAVEVAIRNISKSIIATTTFDVIFLDVGGNVIDTVKHQDFELKPGFSRAVLITSSITEQGEVKSYKIKIGRVTTVDIEKVQLRGQEMRKTKTGEEQIIGTVKNISESNADAAVVATFYGYDSESIGTRVILLRDIAPHSVRPFNCLFKPQEDDKVRTFKLAIGEIEE